MNSRFDYAIIDAINNAFRQVKASPLVLGATASGVGGPVGGYVGYLTQSRVSYDQYEVASSGTPASGMSLVDNLNHIRFRLTGLEASGAPTDFLALTDTPDTYVGSTGKAVVVNGTEDGLEFVDVVSSVYTDATLSGNGTVLNPLTVVSGSFLNLTDTPNAYAGNAGMSVVVSAAEDGLEFVTISGGSINLDGLSDVTISGLADGDILSYDSDVELWINKSINDFTISSDNVGMPKIGSPSVDTLTDDFTTRGSTGVIDGTLTYVEVDTGVNKVKVNAGEGYIRTSNDQQAPLKTITWSAVTQIDIPTPAAGQETVRFIGIEYNAGSPQVTTRTAFDWNWYDDFPLARVSIDALGVMHILNAYAHAEDTANLTRRFLRLNFPFHREEPPEGSGGIEISETGTRNIILSTGYVWHSFNRYNVPARNTSATDTFDVLYRNAAGGYTGTAGNTQWPNTQYDDGSGTLATMTNNRYACLWVYLDMAEEAGGIPSFDVIHGRGQYVSIDLAQAEAAPSPLPDHLTYHGRLISRIIFQKSASTASVIESVWVSSIGNSPITNHELLSGLLGGTTNEHYHLTSAEYAGTGTGNFVRQTSPTLVTPILGVATATSINKVAVTTPATSATLTIADGKTLSISEDFSVVYDGESGAYTLNLAAMASFNIYSGKYYLQTINTTIDESGLYSRLTLANTASAGYSAILEMQTSIAGNTSYILNGGGTINLGGFTLTVPATGTAALLATSNLFSINQTIDGSTDAIQLLVQGYSSQTANIFVVETSAGTDLLSIGSTGLQTHGMISTALSGTAIAISVSHSITPASASSAEYRSLSFINSIGVNAADTTTFSANVYGLFVNNRPRTTGTIFATVGAYLAGLTLDSFSGNATVTNVYGLQIYGVARPSGTSTLTSTGLYGLFVNANTVASVTATTAYGIFIANPVASTLTNTIGIEIQPMTRGSAVNIGLKIGEPSGGAASNYALWLAGTGGTAASGILFGSDVTLYRSAVDTLRTPDAFVVGSLFYPQAATTAGAPAYVNGAIWFDTTLDKLKVGGASAWETVITDTFTAYRIPYTDGSGNLKTSSDLIFDEAADVATFGLTASSQPPIQFSFSANPTTILMSNVGGTVGAAIKGIGSNGTAGSETAVTLDKSLFRVRGAGYDGVTAIGSSATSVEMRFLASETHSNTAHGTKIEFYTTTDTTLNLVKVLTIGGGNKLGFFGVTAVTRPTAYTQTYSTASKTVSTPTAATLTDSTGGTADTTLAAVEATYTQATIRNNFADLAAMVNKNTADYLVAIKLVNSLIDDLQALGLVG